MRKKTLPRFGAGSGWSHPYGNDPFSPFLYADGGDGGGSGSGSGNGGGDGGQGGGAGDGGAGAGAAGGGGGAGAGGSGGAGGGQGGGAAKDGGQGGTDDSAAKIARLEKDLADARKDAGKARTDAKQQAADDAVKALTEKLGKALGLVKEDGPPDPEALAKAVAEKDSLLATREAAIRAKDVELAVYGRAEALGAKAGALLDSRAFIKAVADLDPSDKGFKTALDDAIKTAIKDNPAYAIAPAGRSGGEHGGGSGEGKPRSGSLAEAIRTNYGT